MSLSEVEQAKRQVVMARRRLESSLGALQQRLSPGNLAGEAWDGVKEKGAELADDALTAVRKRPAAVSVALGAFALFLARQPLKRAVTRLVAGEEPEVENGRIVTRIDTEEPEFIAPTPIVGAPVTEGVK